MTKAKLSLVFLKQNERELAMSVTYHVKSLSDLASHLKIKATDLRAAVENGSKKKQRDRFFELGRASEMESIAYMLENTVIDENKS